MYSNLSFDIVWAEMASERILQASLHYKGYSFSCYW